ncbi:MAG: hypothetical protein HJJLKODD_00102 [Phycisphaerae bacterium]|nr:hypothetical protein [Phycisphaerae bacterium]
MTPKPKEMEDHLLAYHMGWLSRAEMEAVDQQLAADPDLARRSGELGKTLAPLENWSALPAVDQLEQSILDRLKLEPQVTAGVESLPASIRMEPVPASSSRVLRFPFSLVEVLTAAACLALMAAVLVPGMARAAAMADRYRCADNLRTIGVALAGYGFNNLGALPFADMPRLPEDLSRDTAPPFNWLDDRSAAVQRLHNSRNRYLLVSQNYVNNLDRFVCPADDRAIVMQFEAGRSYADFADPRNSSYDSQIVLGQARTADTHPQLVVYADANPLFDDRVVWNDTPVLNSMTHQRPSGQNVLRWGGAVDWTQSPNVGVQNDNIWKVGQQRLYQGHELPQSATDTFLIP